MINKKYKTGVLLVNLGTPDLPTVQSVQRYLKEIFNDSRIMRIPKYLKWFIVNNITLLFISRRITKLYKSIWMEDGSPLMVYSRLQRNALANKLLNVPVELSMRYGNPTMKSAINNLMLQGITNLIVLPLYPQFSSTTVGSVWDCLSNIFKKYYSIPNIKFIRDYADYPAYIACLTNSVQRSFLKHGKPDLLVISYHGIPQYLANQGDDYPQRCMDTSIALTKELGLCKKQFIVTFQSRVGYNKWLKPYTDETMRILPSKGIKYIQVISPSFSVDCIETIDELAKQNYKYFIDAGGEKFKYIPALNDDEHHIDMMVELITSRNKI